MHYSASALRIYNHCPHRYYLKYLAEYPEPETDSMRLGSEFHEAVKKLTDFNEKFYDPKVVEMVKALRECPEFKELRILEYEKKIWKVSDKRKFFGIIDAIALNNKDEQVIMEFKTSRSQWKLEDFNDNKIQATLYRHLAETKNFYYFIITKHKTPQVQVSNTPILTSMKEINGICDQIKNDFSFKPLAYKSNKESCWKCPFRERHCSAWF